MIVMLRHFKRVLFLFVVFIIIYCFSGLQSSSIQNHNLIRQVVFVFNKPPDNFHLSFPSGLSLVSHDEGLISWIDSCGLLRCYYPQDSIDTLVIPCSGHYLEFCHKYKAVDNLFYLVHVGDTIFISYDSLGLPHLHSRFFGTDGDFDYNFYVEHVRHPSVRDVESLSLISQSFLQQLDSFMRNPLLAPRVPARLRLDYIDLKQERNRFDFNMKRYKRLLDSCVSSGTIGVDYQKYYSCQIQLRKLRFHLACAKLKRLDSIMTTFEKFFNDSLTSYVSYAELLWQYMREVEYYQHNVTFIRTTNSSYVDSRTVFDNVLRRKSYPFKTKEIMLCKCMEEIARNFSIDDARKYLRIYVAYTGDTITANSIVTNYRLNQPMSNDLLLKSVNGKEYGFSDWIRKYEGQVVYVDFWASWCSPCRTSMPYSLSLREAYKDKNVAFLYLAFRDKEEAWHSALKELGLSNSNALNFFVLNPGSAKMIAELRISTIPRYLLFNRQGKLVQANAPGPEGLGIRKVLDSLLIH